jgi:hypothetical protein
LDTVATVSVNGIVMARSINMHLPVAFIINSSVAVAGNDANLLEIRLDPPIAWACEMSSSRSPLLVDSFIPISVSAVALARTLSRASHGDVEHFLAAIPHLRCNLLALIERPSALHTPTLWSVARVRINS